LEGRGRYNEAASSSVVVYTKGYLGRKIGVRRRRIAWSFVSYFRLKTS